jgi:hypothetical protein
METLADYFTRTKESQMQALRMLGHPVSPAPKRAGRSISALTSIESLRRASSPSVPR